MDPDGPPEAEPREAPVPQDDAARQAKKRRRRRLLIALAVSLPVMAGLLLPVLGKAREKARRINCAGNLKCAGLALLMYSGDSDGYFPIGKDTRALVAGNYVQHGKVFWCPSSPVVVVTPETSSYVYIGSGLKDDAEEATNVPIMHDRETNHPGGWINVLFLDGHVKGYRATSWEALKEQQGW